MCESTSSGFTIKNSLLTNEVAFIISGNDKFNHLPSSSIYFNSDSTYNWQEIENLNLRKTSEGGDYSTNFTYEFCTKCVDSFRPIWIKSPEILQRFLSENNIDELINWMGETKLIKQYLNVENTSTTIIEFLLLLTSLLENSLGNVYLMLTKKSPPHLLRDLLNTEELKNVFGSTPIFFLQIVLGTPNSVNLRNVVWHGFPKPGEIPEYFTSVILLCIKSFSKILTEKNITPKFREKRKSFKIYLETIGMPIEDHLLDESILNEFLLKIPTTHSGFWIEILKFYKERNFTRFIILILPQIELLLRIRYGVLNNIDVKAKLDEYYIILDTVFQQFVDNERKTPNKLLTHVSEGLRKFMFDMFFAIDGPRIRDKLSHGEVDFTSIDKDLCFLLLLLAVNIVLTERKYIEGYESKFHQNCKLRLSLKETKMKLKALRGIEIPHDFQENLLWKKNDDKTISYSLGELKTIEIFFRPQKEVEIVALLLKINEKIKLVCSNLAAALEQRIKMFFAKDLRSRQKKTLNKMLDTLPTVWETLNGIREATKVIFCKMQLENSNYLDQNSTSLVSFSKKLLKYGENLCSLSQITSNEWEKTLKICKEFDKTSEKYFQLLV